MSVRLISNRSTNAAPVRGDELWSEIHYFVARKEYCDEIQVTEMAADAAVDSREADVRRETADQRMA